MMLGLSALVLATLVGLNRLGVVRLTPYVILGVALWFCVLRSGVHATLAGVALALAIPLQVTPARPDATDSPLHRLEHGLQPWVAFCIVPIFGFANAGVSFAGLNPAIMVEPVPLGVAVGLFIGKQVGVFAFAWAAIRAGLADLPANATWTQLYGVALLCGIGFTMSLFIGLLAFPRSPELTDATKVGVLAGSLASAVAGALLLRLARPTSRAPR